MFLLGLPGLLCGASCLLSPPVQSSMTGTRPDVPSVQPRPPLRPSDGLPGIGQAALVFWWLWLCFWVAFLSPCLSCHLRRPATHLRRPVPHLRAPPHPQRPLSKFLSSAFASSLLEPPFPPFSSALRFEGSAPRGESTVMTCPTRPKPPSLFLG